MAANAYAATGAGPLAESRAFAIVPFAIHNAPNATSQRFEPSHFTLRDMPDPAGPAAQVRKRLSPDVAASGTVDPAADFPHVRLTGAAGKVLQTLMTGASRRLSKPECREILTDFVDRDGHTLAMILDRSGRTPGEYLSGLYFVDASTSAQCRSEQIRIAFSAPKSRVIYLCSGRLAVYFSKKTSAGEILLIHELLHALGLGENPPTSDHITDRVWARCDGSERDD